MKKVSFTFIILGIINFIAGFVFMYINGNMTYAKMLGEELIYNNVGESFVDPGVEILKGKNMVEVVTEGEVDFNKLGEYNLVYKIMLDDEEVERYERKVQVVDKKAPSITASESCEISLGTNINNKDSKYYIGLLNVKVEDNYDASDKLKLEFDVSSVNTNNEGVYDVIIKTKDSSDNVTSKKVKIKVKKVAVKSISLNKSSLSLDPGDSYSLTATVSPDNAYDKSVTWSTSNASIAKVDSNGRVTAIAVGKTSVCVHSVANISVKNCIDVTVRKSAKQKLVDALLYNNYTRLNDNVYYAYIGGAKFTINFNTGYLSEYVNTNGTESTYYYYYRTNVGTNDFSSDGTTMYSRYNFNNRDFYCYTDPSIYQALCSSTKYDAIEVLNGVKRYFNTMVDSVGITAKDI